MLDDAEKSLLCDGFITRRQVPPDLHNDIIEDRVIDPREK
jgi:hypothetical protein